MTLPEATIRSILKSQYHAAFAMFEDAVRSCPEALWYDASARNAFWQIAYHVMFFTHLYLQRDETSFTPWAEHDAKVQHPDGMAGPSDPDSLLPLIPRPYTPAQVLRYCRFCDGLVNEAVDALDLESPSSGFHWYRISKLEHQFVNIRHLQHHTAQLADRLRAGGGIGVKWVGSR